jgi:hypothetical protein
VTDKDFIFDVHSLTNKSMTRDFAAVTNPRTFLDFDERTDFDIVTDFAAVQIGEGEYFHPFAKFDVRSYALKKLFAHI